ncbi:DNA recombination protein RmuC [Candidatus Saccharibacteria bacterium QS_5_54_17]|nr:MAG: DNA recombination protein RmuC [Candidatus Saccharibacteria bacterium QS_5_54_17]
MPIEYLILLGAGIIVGVLIAIFGIRRTSSSDNESLRLLQEQMSQLQTRLNDQLQSNQSNQTSMQEAIQKQMTDAQSVISDVRDRLGKLHETNQQVVGVTDQLQSLEDILKNPKQRGVLGEYYLETVLKNVLPPERFRLQYTLGEDKQENKLVPDAAVFLEEGKTLPVDSKFSLENYNRLVQEHDDAKREALQKEFKTDLKNRIDETAKYIQPDLGTMEFAFMFIPSEGVYYDLLINNVGSSNTTARDLIEYAFQEKRVIIVSPTSFMAYLQTVIQGLRSLEIEENVREIQKRVGELHRHIATHEELMQKLGKSLGTTVNHFNTAHKELGKIDKDVVRIADTERVVEPAALDQPRKGDDD